MTRTRRYSLDRNTELLKMHSVPELLPTKVRGVVGGAVAFETTVDLGATFPNATWDESAVPAPYVYEAQPALTKKL